MGDSKQVTVKFTTKLEQQYRVADTSMVCGNSMLVYLIFCHCSCRCRADLPWAGGAPPRHEP